MIAFLIRQNQEIPVLIRVRVHHFKALAPDHFSGRVIIRSTVAVKFHHVISKRQKTGGSVLLHLHHPVFPDLRGGLAGHLIVPSGSQGDHHQEYRNHPEEGLARQANQDVLRLTACMMMDFVFVLFFLNHEGISKQIGETAFAIARILLPGFVQKFPQDIFLRIRRFLIRFRKTDDLPAGAARCGSRILP